MNPYTVRGLAKLDGELIDGDLVVCDDVTFEGGCSKYELTGIVVHSGQASGGHYYSYIQYKQADGSKKWYKFDDGDVSECKLDDDEEMKVQCFGGEYVGEMFDHMLKKMSSRRQKRWWNAYILLYRRVDTSDMNGLSSRLSELTIMDSLSPEHRMIKMPQAIQRSVETQNIRFMHTKNQFSVEFFHFMKRLLHNNSPFTQSIRETGHESNQHETSMLCAELASKFLFNTCFHAKKSLRGPAVEWFEVLSGHLRLSQTIRAWFAYFVLLKNHYRFCDYLLESPAPDVRSAFSKIIVFLCHLSLQDRAKLISFTSENGTGKS
jgi:ubiquitin carboxyl-terminal hydrolase 9/24